MIVCIDKHFNIFTIIFLEKVPTLELLFFFLEFDYEQERNVNLASDFKGAWSTIFGHILFFCFFFIIYSALGKHCQRSNEI